MTEKMSDFKDILRSHNLRPTQQRVNLGKLLFGKLDRNITAEILKQEKSFYGKKLTYILSDPERHINIDTHDDWNAAELLAKKLDI